MTSTLILGGARSGKSRFAQQLALSKAQPVLFVATAEAGDEDMRRRIEQHKKERPATWTTLEVTAEVGSQILQSIGDMPTVILDCITLLVNNAFSRHGSFPDELDVALVEKGVEAEIAGLVDCLDRCGASFIIVSNEVGLGLVPAGRMSRVYRDLLGRANQALAQHVDEVYLLAAGLPLRIKPASR